MVFKFWDSKLVQDLKLYFKCRPCQISFFLMLSFSMWFLSCLLRFINEAKLTTIWHVSVVEKFKDQSIFFLVDTPIQCQREPLGLISKLWHKGKQISSLELNCQEVRLNIWLLRFHRFMINVSFVDHSFANTCRHSCKFLIRKYQGNNF